MAVVVTQPIHVMTIRCMAQFIGKETKYSGLVGGVRSLMKDGGWWSGLVPRLLGELATIVISHSLVQVIHLGFPEARRKAKMGLDLTTSITGLLATSLTYPFTVVGTCLAVSGSGLLAGSPPYMPEFVSWTHAWRELDRHHQLERGSTVLRRYYKGSPNLGLSLADYVEPSLEQFRDPKGKLL